MSRYLILLLINIPFIIAGLLNALVAYKLNRTSKKKFIFRVGIWLLVFLGLALTKPIYEFLFSNNLTHTESLSLFDVLQITGIIFLFFITSRSRAKIDVIERRLQDLHQELSIQLSQMEIKKKHEPPKS